MGGETKPQRSAGRKLRHRAAKLRKTADELDAIAAELEAGGATATDREQEADG
jgi:hypothetical protein